MAKKPLIALLPVLLLPALAALGAAPARAADGPTTDVITVSAGGVQILGGAARTGGIAVTDDLLIHAATKVSGQVTLADGGTVSVNLSGSPVVTGRIHAARNGVSIDAVVAAGVTRRADDVIEWSGPALVGTSVKTVEVTITDRQADPGYHLVTTRHAGQDRTAFVRVPPKRIAGAVTPVLFHFPGLLEFAAAAEQFQHPASAADRHGYLMVLPEHYGIGWQGVPAGTPGADVDDPGYVRALAAQVQQRFGGDPARTYASGMSNGGFFTSLAACRLPDVFAAFAPVSGQLTDPGCAPGRAVPVLMIHGDADPIVAYSTALAAVPLWLRINGCGATSTDVRLPDADPADGTRVVRHTWSGCPANAPVLLYQVEGGGHAWPGGTPYPVDLGKVTNDIDANELIWSFVSRFHL